MRRGATGVGVRDGQGRREVNRKEMGIENEMRDFS